jgi:hypothetical protein
VKLTIEFDEYEAALIRKARKELTAVAKAKGDTPPSYKQIARGAVRMGIHAIFGDKYVADDLLAQNSHPDLVEDVLIDSSQ